MLQLTSRRKTVRKKSIFLWGTLLASNAYVFLACLIQILAVECTIGVSITTVMGTLQFLEAK